MNFFGLKPTEVRICSVATPACKSGKLNPPTFLPPGMPLREPLGSLGSPDVSIWDNAPARAKLREIASNVLSGGHWPPRPDVSVVFSSPFFGVVVVVVDADDGAEFVELNCCDDVPVFWATHWAYGIGALPGHRTLVSSPKFQTDSGGALASK